MELTEQDRAVVREAVNEVFDKLGIDVTDHAAVDAYHADRRYIRASRLATEKVGLAVKITAITIVMGGIASMIWLGIRASIKGAP